MTETQKDSPEARDATGEAGPGGSLGASGSRRGCGEDKIQAARPTSDDTDADGYGPDEAYKTGLAKGQRTHRWEEAQAREEAFEKRMEER